jgi:hypothetical protein
MAARKLSVIITALAVPIAAVFLFMPIAIAGDGAGANKLEGAWVAKETAIGGQWTYVLSPNSSGRSASGHGSIDIGFPVEGLFGPVDDTTPLLIQLEMTGPDTGVANSIWYGRKELPSTEPVSAELVFIGTAHSTFEFQAPGKLFVVHDFAFYSADKDGDGDGFPDSDAIPDLELTLTTMDTRLPSH